jgi:hypothetical protein
VAYFASRDLAISISFNRQTKPSDPARDIVVGF